MIETVTPDTFAAVLERRQGYIVNVWAGHRVRAHSLAAPVDTCRNRMPAWSHQQKLFAASLAEAQEVMRRYPEPFALCSICGADQESAALDQASQGSIGQVIAQHSPDSHTVTLDTTAWSNLLRILGYARAQAELEHAGSMKTDADEMLAALHRDELPSA